MRLSGAREMVTGRGWVLCVGSLIFALLAHAQAGSPAMANPENRLNRGADRNGENLPDSPEPRRDSTAEVHHDPIPARRLSFGERFDIYLHSVSNPDSALGPALGAAVNQATNDPPEWGQGGGGYGRRFASGYGRMFITRTLRFGIAATDHEDPLFHASNETTVLGRVRYATIHYFWVKSDSGSEMPAYSRIGSVYGAAFMSNAWYPASHATTADALLRGTTALSAGMGWNVFREFWPDIKGAMHKK